MRRFATLATRATFATLLCLAACDGTIPAGKPIGTTVDTEAEIQRFLRRAYLDLTGAVPAEGELAAGTTRLRDAGNTADARGQLADAQLARRVRLGGGSGRHRLTSTDVEVMASAASIHLSSTGAPVSTTATPLRVAVVVASTRPGCFGPTVAAWFARHVEQRDDLAVDLLDLAAHQPPGRELAKAVGAADAVVVVTPEYNHSFPGPLKTAVDSVQQEWAAKPVGFVSYGGISGGLRAVEALRLVFTELHAVTVRETMSFALAWERFDGDGAAEDPAADAAAGRLLDDATDVVVPQWAEALGDGEVRLLVQPQADGTRVLVAGAVTHRQRPATAQGVTFLNLEDETGMVNVVCSRGVWARQRRLAQTASALIIRGIVQNATGAVTVVADQLRPVDLRVISRSRDFQ